MVHHLRVENAETLFLVEPHVPFDIAAGVEPGAVVGESGLDLVEELLADAPVLKFGQHDQPADIKGAVFHLAPDGADDFSAVVHHLQNCVVQKIFVGLLEAFSQRGSLSMSFSRRLSGRAANFAESICCANRVPHRTKRRAMIFEKCL